MGEKLFAIPFEALKLDAGREHFIFDIDKEKLSRHGLRVREPLRVGAPPGG